MKTLMMALALSLTGVAAGCSARAADRPASAPSEATVTIPVAGMTCASCSVAVRTALKRIEGVKSVDVDRDQKQARVIYDAAKAKPEQFVEAINKLGYRAGAPARR